MNTNRNSRKTRFRKALIDAGTTARQWAKDNGISRTHLYRVLDDTGVSAPLTQKIDEFIRATRKAPVAA